MDRETFYQYILDNFTLSGGEQRMVDTILQFIESHYYDYDKQQEILRELLCDIDLTEEGKREVQSFITECKTKRNEVLDNSGDTIKHTTIPTQKEILNDLNSQEDVDECWGVTDNYGMKIFLEYGIHFI